LNLRTIFRILKVKNILRIFT